MSQQPGPGVSREADAVASAAAAREIGPGKPRPRRRGHRLWLHLLLFVLTAVSVFAAGMTPGTDSFGDFWVLWIAARIFVTTGLFLKGLDALLWSGAIYAGCLMAILLAHEFGHYIAARVHRVRATLPFFIPFPLLSPFGTLGAVIFQDTEGVDRRKLFDIAIAGPLAGLVVAIPVLFYGAATS
ncbi:MAG: site-2 protease family protein, partial [Planctomycetota bacterium]